MGGVAYGGRVYVVSRCRSGRQTLPCASTKGPYVARALTAIVAAVEHHGALLGIVHQPVTTARRTRVEQSRPRAAVVQPRVGEHPCARSSTTVQHDPLVHR